MNRTTNFSEDISYETQFQRDPLGIYNLKYQQVLALKLETKIENINELLRKLEEIVDYISRYENVPPCRRTARIPCYIEEMCKEECQAFPPFQYRLTNGTIIEVIGDANLKENEIKISI